MPTLASTTHSNEFVIWSDRPEAEQEYQANDVVREKRFSVVQSVEELLFESVGLLLAQI
jgi:hypothetical protein